MKIGKLYKVTTDRSHYPSQLGDLVVVLEVGTVAYHSNENYCTGVNFKTGEIHYYHKSELEEVQKPTDKKCP